MTQARIRQATDADEPAVSALAMAAFGADEGPEIVRLIAELSVDATARPVLSLVATVDDHVVGHVLFSRARLASPSQDVSAALLAPLAVHQDFQSRGIGGRVVSMDLYNLGWDYLHHYRERLQKVTLASAQEAARQHLQPESLVALVVGPAAQCAKDLEALGPLEIVS